jgi:hypothetical protein
VADPGKPAATIQFRQSAPLRGDLAPRQRHLGSEAL